MSALRKIAYRNPHAGTPGQPVCPIVLRGVQSKIHFLDLRAHKFRELNTGNEAHCAHLALARTLREGPGNHLIYGSRLGKNPIPVGQRHAVEIVLSVFETKIKGLVRVFSERRRIFCPQKVEDITQNARIRVAKKAGTWQGDSAFTTWLHRVVQNVVIDASRRTPRRFENAETDVENHSNPFSLDQFPGKSTGEVTEKSTAILQTVDRLSPKLREIILASIHHQTMHEMAAALNLPLGTVKSRLSRARQTLLTLLPAELQQELQDENAGDQEGQSKLEEGPLV